MVIDWHGREQDQSHRHGPGEPPDGRASPEETSGRLALRSPEAGLEFEDARQKPGEPRVGHGPEHQGVQSSLQQSALESGASQLSAQQGEQTLKEEKPQNREGSHGSVSVKRGGRWPGKHTSNGPAPDYP